jgi:Holliday junction resolvasome RuvABC endonuclease subunit
MKIVALDVATQTGVCVGNSGAAPTAWSVNLGKGLSEDQRFSNILKLTHGLIEEHDPDLIAVEAFIGGKNASAYLIGLVACVRGCAANRGVKVVLMFPATVRKHFLGKALTSRDFPGLKQAKAKLAIKERVATQCRAIGWTVPDLDAADAAATWDYACATHARGYQAAPTGGLFRG